MYHIVFQTEVHVVRREPDQPQQLAFRGEFRDRKRLRRRSKNSWEEAVNRDCVEKKNTILLSVFRKICISKNEILKNFKLVFINNIYKRN